MGFRERACCFPPGLGHFLRWFRFGRSYYAGPNPGPRSALKPNPTQARVLFAHALVGSSAGPCEAFFSPFPIVGGGRKRQSSCGDAPPKRAFGRARRNRVDADLRRCRFVQLFRS
jgi:hypothetical protein